jgi:GAF domain-containing protein
MRRRSRAGDKPIKARRRKAATLSRSDAPKVSGRRKPSSTNGNTKIALLKRERDEALEQQKATAEVLRIISASPGDVKPVFDAILANATRLCEAKFGILFGVDDGIVHAVAALGVPPALAAFMQGERKPGPHSATARAMRTGDVIHIPDFRKERGYREGDPMMVAGADHGGIRTLLAVPMLKDKAPIGVIGVFRQEVRPFTDKQIELVQNFAAQAVIAIENARLLNELRQRTDDLTESLEQQTATSELLSVISSSPGELEPVFQAMLANATRICEAKFGALFRFDGESFHLAAEVGTPPEYAEFLRRRGPFKPIPGSQGDRVLQSKRVNHTPDYAAETVPSPAATLGGARSTVTVPMLKDDVLIGVIIIYRQEVRQFTDKQIGLVQNFAAQAVIAIENTRLLNELRESLQQQTATSEVLSVISSSPGELDPVFQSMLANAVRICEAKFGALFRFDGEALHMAAEVGTPPEFAEFQRKRGPFQPREGTQIERVLHTKKMSHIADYAAEALPGHAATLGGARSFVGVPMLKDDVLIGIIAIYRQEVRPFTVKQIALVENFAAQAVIAIENTRLLSELRQSLEQQTATAEVLKVISRSTFDLRTVLDALVESAAQLCEADIVVINRLEERFYRVAASFGITSEQREAIANIPIESGRSTITGRAALGRQIIHIADVRADPEFTQQEWYEKVGSRTMLGVPLLREGIPIGVMVLMRRVVRPFTDSQIALVTTFADQAVIAIENVRLFEAEQQRRRELSEALEQQTATSEVLRVISSSPGELRPVFDAMLSNAVRLCEAKFAMLFLKEGDEFRAVCTLDVPRAWAEWLAKNPIRAHPLIPMGRAASTKQPVHVADARTDQSYLEGLPGMVGFVELGGGRTLLQMPMLKENEVVGMIGIFRQEVRPFTEKQIDLVKNFAAQAVIAIENTRLLNELRESLQQQTATADVLKVISSSPGELEPVFQAMLENATRICDAKFGTLFRFDGHAYHLAAQFGTPQELAEFQRQRGPFVPDTGSLFDDIMRTKQISNVADYAASAPSSPPARLGGARSFVGVPMLKDDVLIGAIGIYRQEARPFTDKQIELVQSFAAQAVIAIENTRLLNELRQSLEQQTATADVLRVISSSPGALEPVFESMLENAVRICEARFGLLQLYEDGTFRLGAMHNAPPAFAEAITQRGPSYRPGPLTPMARAAATKKLIHIFDYAEEPAYKQRDPVAVRMVELAGARTIIVVPMLKENEVIGTIHIYRQEVRPFTEKQIALVQNFAAQAVIAIENTRLLNELRQSLEQQTATSEVLSVISSSPGELEPVFQAMLANATRICEAKFGVLTLSEGDSFRIVTMHNAPPAYAEFRRREPLQNLAPDTALERAVTSRRAAQVADVTEHSATQDDPQRRRFVALSGARTLIAVPMLKENEIIGAMIIYRQEVRPFTDKQVELLTNFAAQAVIAIENTRLLNELRQSLEQQTATAEVLRVISSSPGELEPVFNAMLTNAVTICDAKFGVLFLFDGSVFESAADVGTPLEYAKFLRGQGSFRPLPGSPLDDLIRTKRVSHTPDIAAAGVRGLELARARTHVAVPMLKDDALVGAIIIYRQEIRPFTDKQIALVQNFAAQAVIAIENTRLLNELRQRTEDLSESLEQQTATSKVLEVISRSAFDLHAVFETVAESSVRLCGADRAFIFRFDGELLRMAVAYNSPPEFTAWVEQHPIRPGRHSGSARAALERRTTHIPDVRVDPEYTYGAKDAEAIRTVLGVPILKGDDLLGVMMIYHLEVKPFTDNQIALVETFADQAAIAIENVRLFEEIQDKSRQLEVASQHKSQFLANMSHELRTPLNAILGYTELMADGIYGQLPEKTMSVLKRLESNGRHLLGLINDVLDLSKIEAGQLVLELTDYSLEDIAQTVRSTLEPLAADKKLAFKVEVAAKMPPGHGDGRRLTQVVINLVGNAIKFTDAGEVVIKATATDGSFHLSVRDTGPGISAADQSKLFQEFQQADNAITRKKGGTGLGLAISKRIIEMHGGKIWLESQIGQGSTFSFTVPVHVAKQAETA